MGKLNSFQILSNCHAVVGTARKGVSAQSFLLRWGWRTFGVPVGVAALFLHGALTFLLVHRFRKCVDKEAADELDILQSALRLWGRLTSSRKIYRQGLHVVNAGLVEPQGSPHTIGLLFVGKAECLRVLRPASRRNTSVLMAVAEAEQFAKVAAKGGKHERMQAGRIYRGLARVCNGISAGEKAASYESRAQKLAEGVSDQELKVGTR